jgi:hypothetical protein
VPSFIFDFRKQVAEGRSYGIEGKHAKKNEHCEKQDNPPKDIVKKLPYVIHA